MTEGRRGAYQWLERWGAGIFALVAHCPELLLDKYVAITAFDAGPLAPSPEERRAGWTEEGGVAYSPRLRSTHGLPYALYDEWLVLDRPGRVGADWRRFVAHPGFTLRDPEAMPPAPGRTDRQRREDGASLRALQLRFWAQLERFAPESYVAQEADHLIFVTRSAALFDAARAVPGGLEPLGDAAAGPTVECRCAEAPALVGVEALLYAAGHLHAHAPHSAGGKTLLRCPRTGRLWSMSYPPDAPHRGAVPVLRPAGEEPAVREGTR